MGLAAFLDDGIKVQLTAAVLSQSGVEDGGRLPASFIDFISF